MKKLIALLLSVLFVANAMFLGFALATKCFYPRYAKIIGIEYDNDIYILEDLAGLTWTVEGVEDFCLGDDVALMMFNNFTPKSIYDDVIVKMH